MSSKRYGRRKAMMALPKWLEQLPILPRLAMTTSARHRSIQDDDDSNRKEHQSYEYYPRILLVSGPPGCGKNHYVQQHVTQWKATQTNTTTTTNSSSKATQRVQPMVCDVPFATLYACLQLIRQSTTRVKQLNVHDNPNVIHLFTQALNMCEREMSREKERSTSSTSSTMLESLSSSNKFRRVQHVLGTPVPVFVMDMTPFRSHFAPSTSFHKTLKQEFNFVLKLLLNGFIAWCRHASASSSTSTAAMILVTDECEHVDPVLTSTEYAESIVYGDDRKMPTRPEMVSILDTHFKAMEMNDAERKWLRTKIDLNRIVTHCNGEIGRSLTLFTSQVDKFLHSHRFESVSRSEQDMMDSFYDSFTAGDDFLNVYLSMHPLMTPDQLQMTLTWMKETGRLTVEQYTHITAPSTFSQLCRDALPYEDLLRDNGVLSSASSSIVLPRQILIKTFWYAVQTHAQHPIVQLQRVPMDPHRLTILNHYHSNGYIMEPSPLDLDKKQEVHHLCSIILRLPLPLTAQRHGKRVWQPQDSSSSSLSSSSLSSSTTQRIMNVHEQIMRLSAFRPYQYLKPLYYNMQYALSRAPSTLPSTTPVRSSPSSASNTNLSATVHLLQMMSTEFTHSSGPHYYAQTFHTRWSAARILQGLHTHPRLRQVIVAGGQRPEYNMWAGMSSNGGFQYAQQQQAKQAKQQLRKVSAFLYDDQFMDRRSMSNYTRRCVYKNTAISTSSEDGSNLNEMEAWWISRPLHSQCVHRPFDHYSDCIITQGISKRDTGISHDGVIQKPLRL